MSDLSIFGFCYVVGFVFYVLIGWSVLRRSPDRICKRLRRHPNRRVKFPVKGFHHLFPYRGTPAWDPSKPRGRDNQIEEPGHAVYRLGDDGLVHLEFTPRKRGTLEHPNRGRVMVGPLLAPADADGKKVRFAGAIMAAQFLGVAAGFMAGIVFSQGAIGARLGTALLYSVFGFFASWFVVHVFLIVYGARGKFDQAETKH